MGLILSLSLLTIFSLPTNGQASWNSLQHFGNGSYNISDCLKIDGSGNRYISGTFEGTIDFGGTSLSSAGNRDIFLIKQDANGALVWAHRMGGGSYDQASKIALNASGDIFLVGAFRSTANFSGSSITISAQGNTDGFIAKYDNNGNVLWANKMNGGADEATRTVVAGNNGDVYVGGDFNGSVNLSGISLSTTGAYDCFIAKYDANGVIVWANRLGGSGNDGQNDMSVDAQDNVYTTGGISGTTTVTFSNSSTTLSSSGTDGLVTKYSPTGSLIWAQFIGGSSSDWTAGISTNTGNNFFVTGYFQGTIIIGGTTFISNGGSDVYLVKFDNSGNIIWATSDGGFSSDYSSMIDANANGNISIGVNFQGTATFGNTSFTSIDNTDFAIVEYDQNGNFLSGASAGGNGIDTGTRIGYTSNSTILAVGRFQNDFIAGSQTINSYGDYDIFVVELNLGTTSNCITTTIEDIDTWTGNTITIPVNISDADNFDISSISQVMDYPENDLTFVGFQNIHPSLGTNVNFLEDAGKLYFTRFGNATVNFSGTQTLYELVFQPLNAPNCVDLVFDNSSSNNNEYTDGNFQPICNDGFTSIGNVCVNTPAYNPVLTLPTCDDINDGAIAVSVTGATSPYIYLWTLNGNAVGTSDSLSNIGVGTYHLLVTDANGATTETDIVLGFDDTILPVISTCVADQQVPLNPSTCEITIPDLTAAPMAISDNCSALVNLGVTQSPIAGSTVALTYGDTTSVTITITDEAGNSTSCVLMVTATDDTPPSITCPTTPTPIPIDANCEAAIPDLTGQVTVSDVCENPNNNTLVITQDITPGNLVGPGVHPIILTVTDPSGNINSCTVNFEVIDDIAPTPVCQDITVQIQTNGEYVMNASEIDNGSSDVCAGALTFSIDGQASKT